MAKKLKVFLSAGHGGKDPGAVALGLKEKDINLVTMLKCKSELERHDVEVITSRTKDEYDPVEDEVKEANASGAELAASMHANAGGGDGFEGYCWNGEKGSASKLIQLAATELKAIGQNSRSPVVKSGNHLWFIKGTTMEAVLFESFFVDNDKDNNIGDTKAEQEALGVAYAKAILKYKGITYKEPTKNIYKVQVGAFSSEKNAKNLQKELKSKGYEAVIVKEKK